MASHSFHRTFIHWHLYLKVEESVLDYIKEVFQNPFILFHLSIPTLSWLCIIHMIMDWIKHEAKAADINKCICSAYNICIGH